MTPGEFLHALYGQFDAGRLTLFSIDRQGGRHTDWFFVDQLDAMADLALWLNDRNVWFGVATRREVLAGTLRGGTSDCLAIPALWADIDIAGSNHKETEGLPATMDAALALLAAFPLKPSIVIATGGGLHPYWRLSEPLGASAAVPLLGRWAATWAAHAAVSDLRVDNVFDLPRVLRVPGTVNLKNDALVEVVQANGLLYGVDDLIEHTLEPPAKAHRSDRTGAPPIGIRPGDEFNQRHTGGYVLARQGWTHDGTDRKGDERWLHPWGPSSDCSATVYADDGHTTIWSETVPRQAHAIEVRRPYDPFGLYVALIHDGDFSAASKQLAEEGYGDEIAELRLNPSKVRPREKRGVRVNSRSLDDLANNIIAELVERNDPPHLFSHGEIVTQLDRGQLDPIDRVGLTHVIETSMTPVRVTKNGETPARIDAQVLDLSLYRLQRELPTIEGVVHAPFLRADGTVCADVGYDRSSRLYLASTLPVNVAENPTTQDVLAAVAVVDEFICDFPLESSADRAHIFALLLTLLTRHLVPLVPLFALDGNGPGVGKNLLSECCVYVATGEWVQTDPLPLDAEEQRKQITALMSTGRPVALFDEAHIVSGTSLARLITSTSWGDRLLGYSKQVSYPNRLTVVALGNNIEVHGDMPRRTILIRLASPLSRPELRSEFRHDDLRAWVTNHRAGVLGALLVMLRAWGAAGSPPSERRLGSFDHWAQLVGGVLGHAGVTGFLANADEMRARGATDDDDMTHHLVELRERFGDWGFTAAEVATQLQERRLNTWPPKVGHDERRMASQLGYAYRRVDGRWFGDLMLSTDGRSHGGSRKWMVVERDTNPQVGGDDGDDGDDRTPLYENSISNRDRAHGANAGDGNPSSPSSPSSPPTDPPDPYGVF